MPARLENDIVKNKVILRETRDFTVKGELGEFRFTLERYPYINKNFGGFGCF